MFGFLNSTVLFAAAAALIPLIIHLFSKRRVKIVEFSSLKHLKAMQRRQVRRLKIRQLLLLLLRMLIIALVVFAFARPTSESNSIGSHATVSAVIILDNSASMNRFLSDGNLFEIARKRTEQLLATFGESDEICLLPMAASKDYPKAKFGSPASAIERIKNLTVSSWPGDLLSTYEQAQQLIGSAINLNKEIFIITDRQSSILPESAFSDSSVARLYFVDLPLENSNNVGLTEIDFGGQLILPGHEFDLTVTVNNYAEEDYDNLIASLFINGNRVAQTDFAIEQGQEQSVTFRRAVSHSGFHSGYVEISDDRYMVDNRYYFSFRIPNKSTILIIGNDDVSQFISLALSPLGSDQTYAPIKIARADQLSSVNFADYKVIMLAGAIPFNDSYARRLVSFVDKGGSLFIGCSEIIDIGWFNRNFGAISGVNIDKITEQNVSRAGHYALAELDINHPVFSVFGFERNDPPELKFWSLPQISVDDKAQIIARFTGNRPALIENSYGDGKVLTFAGPITPQLSDLTSHAFFVPLMARITEFLSSDMSEYDLRLFTNNNLTRSLSLAGSVGGSLEMLKPDSSVIQLAPEEEAGSLVIKTNETNAPGIYQISYLGREIDRFALNVDPAEGQLQVTDYDQIAIALSVDESSVVEFSEDINAAVSGVRYGRELWQLFLWLAAAVILIELLLSRTSPTED